MYSSRVETNIILFGDVETIYRCMFQKKNRLNKLYIWFIFRTYYYNRESNFLIFFVSFRNALLPCLIRRTAS